MTVAVEPDIRGVEALSDGSVLMLPLVYEQLVAESADLGDLPDISFVDAPGLGFDEAPWLAQHDQIEQLEAVVSASAPLDSMIYRLAIAVHGDGEDLMQYLMEQWRLAEAELALTRGREADGGVVAGAVEEYGPDGAAASVGGGGDFPGGLEDGDAVGEGEEAGDDPHVGRPSKVSGRRRRGKTGRGGVDAAVGAEDTPAA